MKNSKSPKPRILLYGFKKCGITPGPLDNPEIEFQAADIGDAREFQSFDGVILPQGCFEAFSVSQHAYSDPFFKADYHQKELTRRRNEAGLLMKNKGFLCFVIHEDFIFDTGGYSNFMTLDHTDLCKLVINGRLRAHPLRGDHSITKYFRSEHISFLEQFGNARNSLQPESGVECRSLCASGNRLAGAIFEDRIFFVPARLPHATETQNFFTKLGVAVLSDFRKLLIEAPAWIAELTFPPEDALIAESVECQKKLAALDTKIHGWEKYKRCLYLSGDILAESVANVLRAGVGLNLSNAPDEFMEDILVLDEKNQDLILVEIKGVNNNLSNIDVLKAVGHREQRNKPEDFPSILIGNTFIRGSNSIADKNRAVGSEQVRIAKRNNVLILRTLDLVNLLKLMSIGKIDLKQILEIFTSKHGWLKVSENEWTILDGDEDKTETKARV